MSYNPYPFGTSEYYDFYLTNSPYRPIENTMKTTKQYIVSSSGSILSIFNTLQPAESYAETQARNSSETTYTVSVTLSSFKLRNISPVDKKVHI